MRTVVGPGQLEFGGLLGRVVRRRPDGVQPPAEPGDVGHPPQVGVATAQPVQRGDIDAVRRVGVGGGEVGQPDRGLRQGQGRPVDGVGEHADREAGPRIEEGAGGVPRISPAVSDQAAAADLTDREPECVVGVGTLDLPLRALQDPLGPVAEQPAVAEEMRRGEAAQVVGGAEEPGRRGQRAGVDVIHREPPVGVGERGVSGGVLRAAVRLEFGTGVRQAQPVDHGLLQELGVAGAGDRLDDEPEQAEADVGVLELLVGRQDLGAVGGDRAQRRLVGEGPVQLPEIAVLSVADDAAAVGEQFADGAVADRCTGQPPEAGGDCVVEPEPAVLDQAHDCRGGEHLRVRGDPEQVRRRQCRAGFGVGQAVRRGHDDAGVVPQRSLHTGHPQEGLPETEPALEVVGGGSHGGRGQVGRGGVRHSDDPSPARRRDPPSGCPTLLGADHLWSPL